jgi:hypothetical protein
MIGGKDTESSSGEEQEDFMEEDVSHDKPKALFAHRIQWQYSFTFSSSAAIKQNKEQTSDDTLRTA